MKRYLEFLKTPRVISLLIAAFPARVAYGMVGLAIFFKAQQETQSVAFAGLAIGLNTVSGSLTAGIRGTAMDRWGQRWPLRILVPGYALMLVTLSSIHSRPLILIAAFVLGISAPPINLSVRPLWKDLVPPDFLRTAYALDTATMNTSGVIGPVIATSLALSSKPFLALYVTATLMVVGGGSIALLSVSRNWIPEKKEKGQQALWKNKVIQLLMIEGVFIGFGWGTFNVAVPAFATQEGVPERTAWILASLALANVIGGIAGGLVSQRFSSLSAWRIIYIVWFAFSIPLAFTYPGWSMALVGASIGLVGGAGQVFYFEVLEQVRPKGSQTASLGWIWSVEGSFMALGAAFGGWVCETTSPRYGLAVTTISTALGLFVINLGWQRFQEANKIPDSEEDLRAIADISDESR